MNSRALQVATTLIKGLCACTHGGPTCCETMKSGFQKRKDRDSRQRAAIAAKSLKMTEFFEEAASKNKESCSSTTVCEKNRTLEEAACKNKEGCSSTACEKPRRVEEVEQKVYEVETAYSTALDYTAPSIPNGSCPICCATHRQHVSEKHCATRCVSTCAE